MRALRSPIRLLSGALAALLLAVTLGACSFIVESSEAQCQSDADCARFPGTRCDVPQGVCVAADGGSDACDGAADGGC